MTRPRTVSLALVAALAMCALTAAMAAAEKPEFGKCYITRVRSHSPAARFANSSCTEENATHEGEYEWEPITKDVGFTLAGGPVSLQTIYGATLSCKSAGGRGTMSNASGHATLSTVHLHFEGCEGEGRKWESEGQPEGRVVIEELDEGVFGVGKKAAFAARVSRRHSRRAHAAGAPIRNIDVKLGKNPGGSPPTRFRSAGGQEFEVHGFLFFSYPADAMLSAQKDVAGEAKGKQLISELEGEGGPALLESTMWIRPFPVQAGLRLSLTQTNEERVELNTFI